MDKRRSREMLTEQQSLRRKQAAEELEVRQGDLAAQPMVDSLAEGMTRLRNLLMVRAHDDVQREYGADSMTASSLASMQAKARRAQLEIEAYSCIVIDEEVTEQGYLADSQEWFLEWLFRLRLGSGYREVFEKRVDFYRSPTVEDRRKKFVSVLQHAMPDSRRAPLVLYRLFPRALRLVPAVAFADPLRAQQIRAEQIALLPAIAECHECHGRVLDNGESCAYCGNPIWSYSWLKSD